MSYASRVTLPLLCLTTLLACGRTPESADPYALSVLNETAGAPATPFEPGPIPADQTRVRVSFIGDVPNLPSIGVRSVFLCSTTCTATGVSGGVLAGDDGTGRGKLFSDVTLPPSRIDRIIVQPDPAAGQPVAFRTLRLAQPITLQAGERQEIFLSLSTVRPGDASSLEVTYLGTAPLPPTAGSVVAYRPDRAMAWPAGSPMGLAMAAGSLKEAQLFGMELIDTGGIVPRVAVWPALKTQDPMTVTLKVNRDRIAKGLTAADYKVQLADKTTPAVTMNGDTLTFQAKDLSGAQVYTDRSVIETSSGERIALPGKTLNAASISAQDTSACKNSLTARRAEYEQYFADGTDAIRIFDCENVAPYVHIVLIDRSNRGRTVDLPVTPSVDYPGKYVLRPITSHGTGAVVAINGFTWDGDKGTYMGTGYGTPLGTLITAGTARKKTSTTEAILGFQMQPADRSKGTSAEFFVGASTSLNFGTHNYNVIGSTTSVIRNGACNPNLDTTSVNRWSAVGIGLNRMALVSSTSSGTSSPRDLCSVFEGLGYLSGAIRLDGGPSAAMAWLGQHINPLTGSDYYAFGNARNILNALVWK
ncbi:phosphodiester glycosidase family protein [Deinococcus arboris]|nr:phosphodiester glycosidase family protein [Deinococcus arboris]